MSVEESGEENADLDLNVDPDLVRLIVAKASAVVFEMPDAEDDEPEIETELDAGTGYERSDAALAEEDEDVDGTREEVAAMIDSLNVDEQAELLALTYIGRGDYEPSDLKTAIRDAKAQHSGPASHRLFEIDIFPSYLETGLDSYEDWRRDQPE
ncbi:DUF3775 domain-containing protein [Acuticoccus sp. M5D2P5]|uniref:DUF3775 domain-containing protein n=1 Tax=Acuticoccus kalidii TaxID=2910977 RepID=UPI001F3E7A3F|nr:DUF3775 domain-containing protein [Acuticoccus kalidii]MCF3932324.1 DUF3775 domain-containing protein [Acuticoccus kalidii]